MNTNAFSKHGQRGLMLGLCLLMLSACSENQQNGSVSPKPLPEPNSVGAKLLKEYCSDCHLPPNPATHVKGEWKSVVVRMSNHRKMQSLAALNDEEIKTLTEYLDKHAPGSLR